MVKPLLTNANRFRLCWALLAAATVAACSGTVPSAFHPAGIPTALPTSTPTSTPKPTPTPTGPPPAKIVISPSRLDFTSTGSAAKQPVEVTQTGYPGGFTVKDDCSGIATILPNVNQRGAALFTVTPIAKGSCTATFSGGSGASAPLTIVVQPPGGVTVMPASLSFTQSGSSASKSTSVSQKGYDGDFTESDDCGGIATIALTGGSLGAKTYTVTPEGTGTCTADFTGAHNELGRLAIAVHLPGGVAVSPDTLAFTALGSGAAQDASVSQSAYEGSFSESNTCAGKATIVRTSESAGKATYSVTPVAAGSCTATFTGGNAQTGSLSISIAPYGQVVVAPSGVTFTATGSGAAQSVAVSQANYAGAFAESDTCGSIATVAAESNEDGKGSYRVTPLGRGTCTATFTGGGKASAPLSITVAPFGNVDVTPATLTFNATGSGNAQHAGVSQSGYTGSYTETNDCGTTANVNVTANGSGTAAVTVTPQAAGACSATFTGGNGETGVLKIVVELPGGVVASPAPLNFALTGSAHGTTVTVTQSGYTGSYTESDSCGRIAKVVQLSNANGTAQYRVTPFAVGTCSVLFAGGNAETFALAVSVTQTNVVINGSHKP